MSQALGQADHELPEPRTRPTQNTWTLEEIGVHVFEDFIVVRPDWDPDSELPTLVGRDEQDREIHSLGGKEFIVARDPKEGDEQPEPSVTGVVVGVGPGELIVNPWLAVPAPDGSPREPFAYKPMTVEVGQHVTHSKYGITEVEVAGETLRMMRPDALRLGLPGVPEDITPPDRADG